MFTSGASSPNVKPTPVLPARKINQQARNNFPLKSITLSFTELCGRRSRDQEPPAPAAVQQDSDPTCSKARCPKTADKRRPSAAKGPLSDKFPAG